MTPKRLSFSASSFSDFFTTKQQEMIFLQEFVNRSLVRIHTLDLEDLKKCEFFKFFEELNVSIFPCSPSREVYPSLVKTFFSNIYLTGGILHYEVKRHMMTLSIEKFRDILNLPHEDIILEFRDKVRKFNLKLSAYSLMNDPPSSIPNTFTTRYIYPESHMFTM